jgi:hypothetical protein
MITGQMRPLAHHPHKMAQGLASLGRGGDSMLVHMSPSEVGALNKIAMATGGQLTRNPHTGLYEAGWLSSLLPMLAGGIATVFTGGMAAPLLAGAATGALTGDKKMPLWARLGLGALGGFGGAGLAGSLAGGATSTAAGSIAEEGAKNAIANGASTLGDVAAGAGVDAGTAASTLGADAASQIAGTPLSEVASTELFPQAAANSAEGIGSNLASSMSNAANQGLLSNVNALGDTSLAGALNPGAAGANGLTSSLSNTVAGGATRGLATNLAGAGDAALANTVSPGAVAAFKPFEQTSLNSIGQGIKGLGTSEGRNAFVANAAKYPFGAKGLAMASAAPFMMQSQPTTGIETQKPWYYTAAPGQSSLYNPGVINPNIAKLGYLPAGQSAFIGQQWNPGVFTQTFPGMPQAPSFDQGGSTTPAPSMSNALSGMNDYYKNMLSNASSQNAMTPTVTTPSPDAMNAYLARATQMVTPQSASQPTVADVTPSQTPNKPPFSPRNFSGMGDMISYLRGMGGGMSSYTNPDTGTTTNYPAYSYDPQTGQFTQTSSGADWRGGMHMAQGGLADLTPNYAAGGKLLHGGGDGMSDSIPAVIGGQKPQRAALADGEFVVPADVVSHLGNGSTNAGAKRLYAMMDKVRQARTGNPKQGKQINPDKYLPA